MSVLIEDAVWDRVMPQMEMEMLMDQERFPRCSKFMTLSFFVSIRNVVNSACMMRCCRLEDARLTNLYSQIVPIPCPHILQRSLIFLQTFRLLNYRKVFLMPFQFTG